MFFEWVVVFGVVVVGAAAVVVVSAVVVDLGDEKEPWVYVERHG